MNCPIFITNPEVYIPDSSSVYWVHEAGTEGLPKDEGYIGVTSIEPEKRIKGHIGKLRRLKAGISKNPKVFQLRLLEGLDSLEVTILFSGLSAEDSRVIEYLLRPTYSLGWNMSVGGGNKEEIKTVHRSLKDRIKYKSLLANSTVNTGVLVD